MQKRDEVPMRGKHSAALNQLEEQGMEHTTELPEGAEMVTCPECEGRRYDAASYRRAKHPDEIEDCGTCKGEGEVPADQETAR